MAGKSIEIYEREIEVIKSFPYLSLMHDEIIQFAIDDPPAILCLYKLKAALLKNHKLNDSHDPRTLDKKHLPTYDREKSTMYQDILDLLNFEIEEFGKQPLPADFNFEVIEQLLKSERGVCFYPDQTFYSKLSEQTLRLICKDLVDEKFIAVKAIEDFVHAFSMRKIEGTSKINWLCTYKKGNDNIGLALLMDSLASEEFNTDFKLAYVKMNELFILPIKPKAGSRSRSFEISHRNVRNKDLTLQEIHRVLLSILQPYLHSPLH